MVSGALTVVLGAVLATGCATHRYNIIARDAGHLPLGQSFRDVEVVRQDGSLCRLEIAVVATDALYGTTDDHRDLKIPFSEIRTARRREVDARKTLNRLWIAVPLAALVMAAPFLAAEGPIFP